MSMTIIFFSDILNERPFFGYETFIYSQKMANPFKFQGCNLFSEREERRAIDFF